MVIGYKTKTVNEKEVIVVIWCNVCAKHKNKLKSSVQGAAIQSLKAFTCKTNIVTKHQVNVQFIYFWVGNLRTLIKLKSYSFLCKMAVYLDILEAVGPTFPHFWKESSNVQWHFPGCWTVLNLEDLCDEGLDYTTDSYFPKFFIKYEVSLTNVISNYTKATHERKKQRTEKTLWCSGYHYSTTSFNKASGSAQVQILLAVCQRFAMVKISDNGPGWK